MKKLVLFQSLTFGLFLFSQSCYCQINLVLGLSKSSIIGGESWRDPIGLQAGANMPFASIHEALSLVVEANLSMQGAKWEEFPVSGRVHLLYINAPIFALYRTKIGFFGEIGIQPGFLISAKDKYEGITEGYMKQMKKFDVSIPLGIGYEFKNNFNVGIRAISGLSDITKDEDVKDRNFVVALRVSYTLGQ